MGRFEKQPENPRARGELSRAAENALWAVVEDLENLQQNVIRSLQEDVKRLQSEKNRLTDDIQHLLEEKEHLQQVRQITEQQVLIRQLAEVLAKHISSQLQSSLTTLATQADENSYERSALKSAEVSNKITGEINEKVEHMFGSLDDTVTITFNSLQQELKNYQSNLSQQLSRMYSQQQQGEEILAEFVNRLQGKLEKTIEETSRKAAAVSPPTVLQPTEPQKKSSETSPQLGEVARTAAEPISVIPRELPESKTTSKPPAAIAPPIENAPKPISIVSRESSESEATPKPPAAIAPPIENVVEPISILSKDLPKSEAVSPPATPTPQQGVKQPPSMQNVTEPISVIPRELSENETVSPPATRTPQQGGKQSSLRRNQSEPISILSKESSASDISPPATPTPQQGGKQPPPKRNQSEPISVLSRDLSKSKTTLEPPTTPASRQRAKTPRSPSSQTLSSIQIGLLLVVLSTVISSLYNVAIKIIFHEGSQIFGVVEVERLLSPSLGNILLIMTLRFMVVVPLMVLLAPILHPRVWQDIQNLADSVRGNSTPANVTTQRTLVMSVASGCFLFVSQVLIYTAIGQVATGMAIALFFIYPIVSGLLAWFLFRDRPSALGASAIASICCGELLVLAGSLSTGMGNNIPLGSSAAIISGAAFAGYVILTRICADQLHPVTFTLINFATMLLLSFICLMLPLPGEWNLLVDPSKMLELVLSAFILGVLTLSGYLFNIFGTRNLGALQSPIIGASVPVLTVIFAGFIIQENLDIVQILGVLLVTFGAAAFSLEKMRNQVKSSSSTN
ncbi:EamA family transporter [Komarekiella sp. 'clone 1']|uniref:EamA family transporter n=1 Tax=Komarekiella delphini-convector SJRDD-AB1 TaxID=2593771 RepID=A0AA40VTY0_9NOST|nr:EamA family transporter [Komarekiella delphini-convector]MBD6619649.1 EamA family transporter [Komarekiella delphini-convector SJRDD-AB1]